MVASIFREDHIPCRYTFGYRCSALEQSIVAGLPQLAIRCAWSALDSKEAVSRNWSEVFDLLCYKMTAGMEDSMLKTQDQSTAPLSLLIQCNPSFNGKNVALANACVRATRDDEKAWMVMALRDIGIRVEIPQDKVAFDILRLAIQSELSWLAVECSWKLLSSRELAEQHLVALLDQWNRASEGLLATLLGPDYRTISLVKVLMVLNPFTKKEAMAEDSPAFYVLHYGPVAITCLQTECKKPVDVHALQAAFRYQAHFKETSRTYFKEAEDLKIGERKKRKKNNPSRQQRLKHRRKLVRKH